MPARWRGPAFGFLTSRPWPFIGVLVVGAMAAGCLPFDTSGKMISDAFLFVGLALPLALTTGAIGGDRTPARWALLFQRSGTVSAHYARTTAIAVLVLAACLLPGWLTLVGGGIWRGASLQVLLGFVLGSLIWALEVLAAGTLWTVVVRRRDAELTVLYLFLTFVQGVIVELAHLPHAGAVALESVLMPLNGSITLWQNLGGAQNPFEPRWAIQMIGFPVAVAVITAVRLRQLGRADLTDVAPD